MTLHQSTVGGNRHRGHPIQTEHPNPHNQPSRPGEPPEGRYPIAKAYEHLLTSGGGTVAEQRTNRAPRS